MLIHDYVMDSFSMHQVVYMFLVSSRRESTGDVRKVWDKLVFVSGS